MLTPDGYVAPRKIEGVSVNVLYDRSYAVYKIATSLVEPLLIGGYSSQKLRDILVGLVEDAITQKRPTVRFESGKAIQLEEYYLHGSHSAGVADSGVGNESPIHQDNFEPYVGTDSAMTPSDVAAGLVDVDNHHHGEFELLPTKADEPAAESAPIDISENLLETPEAVTVSTEASAKVTATRKGARK